MEGRNKRLSILLVVAAAIAAVVAGTAGARTHVHALSGTLDIYGYGPGDDVQENRAAYAAAQLQGVTIKREAPSFDDQAFLTRLASGDIPDLVRMPRPSLALYAAKGVLQPVNSCVTPALAKQYRAGAIKAMSYSGKLYGLPEFTNQVTLVVNVQAFQEAGVPLAQAQTKNLKQLLATAKKLTKFDSSGNLTRIGFDPKIDSGFGFPMWVKYFGKNVISANGLKAQINTPAAVKALTFALQVINVEGGWNKFVAYRNTFDFFGAQNPLVKDQLGFWPMESFIYNVFANNSPKQHIAARYFQNQKGGPITFFSGNGWAIPKGSKNFDAACAYMKAVTSVDAWDIAGAKRLAARRAANPPQAFTGLYTANAVADKKLYEDVYHATGNPDYDDAVKFLVNAPKYGFELPPTPAGAQFANAYSSAIQRVLTRQQTVKAALAQAQKEAQAAINANK
jgi:multiple sugar transport system substrate-binding protein